MGPKEWHDVEINMQWQLPFSDTMSTNPWGLVTHEIYLVIHLLAKVEVSYNSYQGFQENTCSTSGFTEQSNTSPFPSNWNWRPYLSRLKSQVMISFATTTPKRHQKLLAILDHFNWTIYSNNAMPLNPLLIHSTFHMYPNACICYVFPIISITVSMYIGVISTVHLSLYKHRWVERIMQ